MFFCPALYSWKVDPVQTKVTQVNTFATLRVIYLCPKAEAVRPVSGGSEVLV